MRKMRDHIVTACIAFAVIGSLFVLVQYLRPEQLVDTPLEEVLGAVVIEDIWFHDSRMSDALGLVIRNIDQHCKKGGIASISVEAATSEHEMSFGSTAMTARMALDMIASEARMNLIVDPEDRSVSFEPLQRGVQ